LQKGSYEELLQSLDREVSENQHLFGEDDAVLFATHADHVVVLNEGGAFFKVPFTRKDGLVKLGKPTAIPVRTLSESQIVSDGVNSFFSDGSLADSLRSIINLRKEAATSPLEKVETELAEIFSGGQIWRKKVSESASDIAPFAWDANLGSLKINVRPVFADLIEGDEPPDGDEIREDVVKALLSLEGRLSATLSKTRGAFEKYQECTQEPRDEEADSTMSQFDSFAGDYLEHVSEISKYVASTLREGREGCIACMAFVHDEIAKRFKELELGSRFIRKVSGQFQQ